MPLEGRPIADTRQGRVEDALALFRAKGYGPREDVDSPDVLACTGDGTAGAELLFCTHGGGHQLDPAWIGWAYRRAVSGE